MTLDVILAPMRKKERGDDLLLAMNPHHSLQLSDPDHLHMQTRPKKQNKSFLCGPACDGRRSPTSAWPARGAI